MTVKRVYFIELPEPFQIFLWKRVTWLNSKMKKNIWNKHIWHFIHTFLKRVNRTLDACCLILQYLPVLCSLSRIAGSNFSRQSANIGNTADMRTALWTCSEQGRLYFSLSYRMIPFVVMQINHSCTYLIQMRIFTFKHSFLESQQ